jgi:hypothetical protein
MSRLSWTTVNSLIAWVSMDTQTLLLISFLTFVVVSVVAMGLVIPFMIQIDVCGCNTDRDL